MTYRLENPTSGHSEYDRSEESKGYDRGQQTQARLKFHRSLLATSVLRNPSRALVPASAAESAWRGGESGGTDEARGGSGHLTKRQAEPQARFLRQRVICSGCTGAHNVHLNVSASLGRLKAPHRNISHEVQRDLLKLT